MRTEIFENKGWNMSGVSQEGAIRPVLAQIHSKKWRGPKEKVLDLQDNIIGV